MSLILQVILPLACLCHVSAALNQCVERFHVYADIRYRFATTKINSVVRNIAGTSHEVSFDATLPDDAFIASFSMTIDGKVYGGKVMGTEDAKKQFKQALRTDQSSGNFKVKFRNSNQFYMSVNVANGTAVDFTLVYQQVIIKTKGSYQYEIKFETEHAVKDFNISIFIEENSHLYTEKPKLNVHNISSGQFVAQNDLIDLSRPPPSPKTALIRYRPSLEEQGYKGIVAHLVANYDVEKPKNGQMLTADGYFIHTITRTNGPLLPKDIIFVLDVSGSMKGKKIKQLKDAMNLIIEDLREQDRFNILLFNNTVSQWKSTLSTARFAFLGEAKQFIGNMAANGGTNINDALILALKDFQRKDTDARIKMIFFLTDGEPTKGEKDEPTIVRNVKNQNSEESLMYCLAFGDNANFDFLKTLCTQNFGFARKIYAANDAATQVEDLYYGVSSVAMKDVKVTYPPSVINATETYFPVVLDGSEKAVGGFDPTLKQGGKTVEEGRPVFQATVEGTEKDGDFDIVLDIDNIDEITVDTHSSLNSHFTMPRDHSGTIEKMWAFISIKQMLEKKQAVSGKDSGEELDERILEMSLRYKFVTPLTSIVVNKPGTSVPVYSGLVNVDDQAGDTTQLLAIPKLPSTKNQFGGHRYVFGPVPFNETSPGNDTPQSRPHGLFSLSLLFLVVGYFVLAYS